MGEDRRWEKFGAEYFAWTAKHDAHFANKVTIANIGAVIGQRTQLFYQAPRGVSMQRNMDGMYYALLEGRFFFDFVHEDRLEPERLKKYAALILPNIALLSDEQCAHLRTYVEQGGSLVATFETSMYTNDNQHRADFGLADVLGIHAAGPVIGRRGNSNPFYARIERQHPILDGFNDTNWLPGAEYRQPVAPVESPVLTVVPGFVSYPPELSYPPVRQTTEPAVVFRKRARAGWRIFLETSNTACGSPATRTSVVCCRTRFAGWRAKARRLVSKARGSSRRLRGRRNRGSRSTFSTTRTPTPIGDGCATSTPLGSRRCVWNCPLGEV
jgi:hypothetical protein